jgi:hypothetical protein
MFYEEFWYGYHGGAFCGLSIKCKLVPKIFHDNFVISPIFYELITNQLTGDGPFISGLENFVLKFV